MAGEAGEPPKNVVAHAPEWMVRAFKIEGLVAAGLVVSEPSPELTPPKEGWALFHVDYTFTDRGTVVVHAPDAGAAERAARYRAMTSGDLPVERSGDATFDARPLGKKELAGPAFCEWDPEVDA